MKYTVPMYSFGVPNFFSLCFSLVPFSPINGPSLNIGQQFNLVSMLDWIRSMLWLYDVISGGHPAVRLGQMTFKIHTVWPTSKHPTLFTTTLSSSLGIFTIEILIVGKCCRHLWVLSPVFNTIPWLWYKCYSSLLYLERITPHHSKDSTCLMHRQRRQWFR